METEVSVQAACNWNRIGGCELYQCVHTRVTHEDIFVKPELDDVILKDNAILLNKVDVSASCELQLRLQPTIYKIEAISLVCTAPRMELFVGPLKEYTETVYGEIAEFDDEGEVFSYRYDIEVHKSGVVDLLLKLLVSTEEVCLFGILLQIAPNPNGITTGNVINLENVQKLLSGGAQKLSPSAEKCMMFMQAASSQPSGGPPVSGVPSTSAAFLTQMTQALSARSAAENWANDLSKNALTMQQVSQESLLNLLTAHIDRRFGELEERISQRLDAAAIEQNARLDKIVQFLEKRGKD